MRHAFRPVSKIVCATLNVRSLRNKVDAVDDLVRSGGLNVLGVTESWHEGSSCVCIARLRALGYSVVEEARPIPPEADLDSVDFINHGGIVILARSGLQLHKIDSLGKYSTFEYVCARVTSCAAHLTFLLVYRPGSVPPSAEFFDEFESIIAKLMVSSDIVLITGDTNVRLDRPDELPAVSFAQILMNFQLRQHVVYPTHSLGGVLDIVVSHEDLCLDKPCVEFVAFSDHLLVKWTLNVRKPDIVLRTTKGRDWKAFENDAFRTELTNLFPDQASASAHVAAIGDVDALTELYNSAISTLMDKHAPPTDVTYRERRSNEWFDDACQDAKTRARYLDISERGPRLTAQYGRIA